VPSTPTVPPALPTSVVTPTITTTFLPLPEIVLQFPESPDGNAFQENPAALKGPEAGSAGQDAWYSPGRYLFIGFIVTIWVILGGWFFFSIRKLE